MARSVVRWFNVKKGMGFIIHPEGGPDVFVHYTDIVGSGFKTLSEGENVEFEITQGKGGKPKACTVRRQTGGSELRRLLL